MSKLKGLDKQDVRRILSYIFFQEKPTAKPI